MRRVSTDLMNNDMQFWLRRGERDMANLESQMATQKRIQKLRDDPLGAARAVRWDSVVERLKQYEGNAQTLAERAKLSEGYARQAIDIMQRVREIAVQGANGIYTKDDQRAMAVEVEELAKELVSLANSKSPDGTYLFAGGASQTEPFRAVEGTVPGTGTSGTVAVQYLAGWKGPQVEVAEGETLPLGQSGSEVFWAERMQVVSGFDARDWKATSDSSFAIDGVRIDLKAGDTVQALAAKINDSGAAAKASIDPRRFSLALEATLPHQLRLEDLGGAGGAGALAQLGLVAPTGRAPDNLAPSARVSGGSLFDVVLRLRDSLNRGDVLETGGLALAGVDAGLANLNRRVTEIGSRSERLDFIAGRLNKEIPDTTRLLSSETDLDITQAATDYKMLEYSHRAVLGFAGKLFPQTLLDFLR